MARWPRSPLNDSGEHIPIHHHLSNAAGEGLWEVADITPRCCAVVPRPGIEPGASEPRHGKPTPRVNRLGLRIAWSTNIYPYANL